MRAVCVKDVIMDTGKRNAIKGKVYEFEKRVDLLVFINESNCQHHCPEPFFNEHFKLIEEGKVNKMFAKLKTAEAITGVKGCTYFECGNISYPVFDNSGFEFQIKPIDDKKLGYDYELVANCPEQVFAKKEWLYDFRTEPDWDAVSERAKTEDVKVLVWDREGDEKKRRYLSHVERGNFFCFEAGLTRWAEHTGSSRCPWNHAELVEDK